MFVSVLICTEENLVSFLSCCLAKVLPSHFTESMTYNNLKHAFRTFRIKYYHVSSLLLIAVSVCPCEQCPRVLQSVSGNGNLNENGEGDKSALSYRPPEAEAPPCPLPATTAAATVAFTHCFCRSQIHSSRKTSFYV